MNIREALRVEHSKRQTMAIVRYVGNDPERFRELMAIFLGGEYRPTQRSAWAVNYCAEHYPELVKPYLSKLIGLLEKSDGHDAIRRNVARLLQFVEIPARLRGRVYAACYELVDDTKQPVAVRVFALTVAAGLARDEPDLMSELHLLCDKYLPTASAGFKSRARRVLAQ
jgi:hypothetical protein